MSLAKRLWTRFVPYSVRKGLSDLRHFDSARNDTELRFREMQSQINALRQEIDELRADQRTVAELMDVVETVALEARTSISSEPSTKGGPAAAKVSDG